MRIMPLVAGGACLLTISAAAHSWYPIECCSGKDCMPADAVRTDANGDYDVVIGMRHVRVPRAFRARPSPDNRPHICFMLDNEHEAQPLCLFLPGQA